MTAYRQGDIVPVSFSFTDLTSSSERSFEFWENGEDAFYDSL